MKILVFNSRKTWLWLLTAMLLFLSTSNASADMNFGDYCEVKHSPTLQEPWIELRICWYDTNGSNAGFAIKSLIDGYELPYLEIDGMKAVSLKKFQLDFSDESEDWFEDERQNDSWWGDQMEAIVDGNLWRFRLWDSSKHKGRYYAHLFILPCHYDVGKPHKFSIKGDWCHN